MKILMAMSGGIDSTVAAMRLLEAGHELVGVTFRTFDSDNDTCGSLESVMEAKQMAERLGFEHHILDFRDTFRQCVVTNFVDEYMNGRTPNPCVICNSSIKWGRLLEMADKFGCEKIATGHYAKISRREDHYFLANAKDIRKDQTYFLWMLTEENLSRTIFPLGDFTKQEVRAMAAERGYKKLSEKSESQEICFIPDNDYRAFLAAHVTDFETRCHAGDFVDIDGKKIGTHAGFANYTIGQRKGLKVAFGTPKFVTKIDAERNLVTLGDRNDLYADTLAATRCRITDHQRLIENPRVLAKIRYNSAATPATVEIENNRCRVVFDQPVWGITPGQSLVLYQDEMVVGGGFIE